MFQDICLTGIEDITNKLEENERFLHSFSDESPLAAIGTFYVFFIFKLFQGNFAYQVNFLKFLLILLTFIVL